jgi:CheY-like chemotaxis protein
MTSEPPYILIVDDESDSLTFLFDLLHNEGYRVIPKSGALEALSEIARRRPWLVISDLRMPDVDGLELLDRIRKEAPQTRVILLTAYGTKDLAKDVARRGGEAVLLKPSTNTEILRAVRKALEDPLPKS